MGVVGEGKKGSEMGQERCRKIIEQNWEVLTPRTLSIVSIRKTGIPG
jgi:hypothetical protein